MSCPASSPTPIGPGSRPSHSTAKSSRLIHSSGYFNAYADKPGHDERGRILLHPPPYPDTHGGGPDLASAGAGAGRARFHAGPGLRRRRTGGGRRGPEGALLIARAGFKRAWRNPVVPTRGRRGARRGKPVGP